MAEDHFLRGFVLVGIYLANYGLAGDAVESVSLDGVFLADFLWQGVAFCEFRDGVVEGGVEDSVDRYFWCGGLYLLDEVESWWVVEWGEF